MAKKLISLAVLHQVSPDSFSLPENDAALLNDMIAKWSARRRSTMEARFQHAIDLAGLGGLGFTPHCMRHSSVTHESLRFSLEAVRRKHGHVYSATTQGYMHVSDEMVNDEINKAIGSQLDQILGTENKGKKK